MEDNLGDVPNLKRIPVVILTASQVERDILHVYDLLTNCHINRPEDRIISLLLANLLNSSD